MYYFLLKHFLGLLFDRLLNLHFFSIYLLVLLRFQKRRLLEKIIFLEFSYLRTLNFSFGISSLITLFGDGISILSTTKKIIRIIKNITKSLKAIFNKMGRKPLLVFL